VVDGGLVVFLYSCRFLLPTHHIEDATIGDDLSFKSVVDCVPVIDLNRGEDADNSSENGSS
jgi:hypothetical protein